MRFLPFERQYQLESEPCPRCSGTGLAPRAATNRAPECWNCRGLGRKITKAGRLLFYEICELLGKPVRNRESRIVPRHLETIEGAQLRVGMRVAAMFPTTGPLREIVHIEPLPLDQARARFADGSALVATSLGLFARELTAAELAAVEQLMAERAGQGAQPRD